jgi:hypothetical protein
MTNENPIGFDATAADFHSAMRAIETDMVVVIRHQDYPDCDHKLVVEKRRQTHSTSPVRRRGRGGPFVGR